MLVCDRCEQCWHSSCAQIKQSTPIHSGPWFCFKCRAHILTHGPTDVIEDIPLLEYLFAQTTPQDPDEESRVQALATIFRSHGRELQVNVLTPSGDTTWVNVPPLPLRR